MMTLARTITFLAALSLSAGRSDADAPKAKDVTAAKAFIKELIEPTPLPPEVRQRIRKRITDLSNDEWKVRHGASKELLKIGPRAEPMVAEALRSHDLEVRTRATLLLEAYRAAHENRAAGLTSAVDVLAEAGDKSAIDALVKLLAHSDADVRYAAEYGLRRLTGKQFGYNAHAAEAERSPAAKKWHAWWQASRPTFRFQAAAALLKTAGVVTCDYMTREVFVVDLAGKVRWSRKFGDTKRPYAADALPNGNVLISFYHNGKSVIEECTRSGKVVWTTQVLELRGVVQDVRRLANGNTLVTDPSGRRVIEIDPSGKRIVWQYDCQIGSLSAAQRLSNGNTLICLYSGTVVEVSKAGKAVWAHDKMSMPRDAQKLPNGNVLIAEYGRQRVVEISRGGKEVWQWVDAAGRPVSACRLADGRTVVHARRKGLLLVSPSGKEVKTLTANRPRSYEKVRPVPASFFQGAPREPK